MTNNQVQGSQTKPLITEDYWQNIHTAVSYDSSPDIIRNDPAQQHLADPIECVGTSVPQAVDTPIHPGSLGDTFHRKPRLLDLFCGAGGAAMGYHRAGFEVVGVDINPQPNYPFKFIQADCMKLGLPFLRSFDAIHASPPCQSYTRKSANWGRERKHWIEHPDLLDKIRNDLDCVWQMDRTPHVIENVVGAPMRADLVLCGTQFGLRIIKHRQFETSANFNVTPPECGCNHANVYNPWQGKGRSAAEHREAQGTPWIPQCGGASRKKGYTGDLNNAIPPAYTEFIGRQLMAHLAAQGIETGTGSVHESPVATPCAQDEAS